MKGEFLRIPNNIIVNKKYKNNLLSILVYLSCCENKLNICKLSFSEFIEFGLWSKPKYGKSGVIAEAKEFIDCMIDDEYLIIKGDLGKITLNTNIVGKLNIKYESDNNNESVKWFKDNYKDIPRGQLASSFANERMCFIKKLILKNVLLFSYNKPDFVSYAIKDLPNSRIEKLRKKGICVLGWTIRDKESFDFAKKYCDSSVCEYMDKYINN